MHRVMNRTHVSGTKFFASVQVFFLTIFRVMPMKGSSRHLQQGLFSYDTSDDSCPTISAMMWTSFVKLSALIVF